MSRALLSVIAIALMVLGGLAVPMRTATANPPFLAHYYTGSGAPYPLNDLDSSKGTAIWRVNFTDADQYILAGLQLSYKTPGAVPWKAIVEENDTASGRHEYVVNLPQTLGQMRTGMINFNGPYYKRISSNFSLVLRPQATENTTLMLNSETLSSPTLDSHTYFSANLQTFTMLKGYELMWSAVLENISDLDTGETGATSSVSPLDQLDCYRVLLVAGTPYLISLDNSNRGTYLAGLYSPDDILASALISMTGKNATPSMTFTPKTDGFYYLLIDYPNVIGGMSYTVKVRTNRAPVPVISGDTKVNVNQTAHFSADGTTDPDGDPITYSWDFDASDGITSESTKKAPTWTFKKGGDFTVTLTVSDGKQTNSTSMRVHVNTVPFGTIGISSIPKVNETTRLDLDTDYTFSAQYTDPDKDKLAFHWDFGDNTTADLQNIGHTYIDKGVYSYTLTLNVNDSQGGLVTQTLSLVFNRIPKASIIELKKSPALGQKIDLTGIGSDTDGYIVEYRWDFEGDGKIDFTSKNSTAEHTYTSYGSYNLTLYVVDNDGGVGKAVMPIVIKKKSETRSDNTMAIAAAVVIVIVVVLIVSVLILRKKKKAPAPPTGPSAAIAPIPPPAPGKTQEQAAYESLYGPGPTPQPPPQQYQPVPQQPPKPDTSIPGQRYQPIAQQGGVSLVPPPQPAKPAGPKLVPPPKPS